MFCTQKLLPNLIAINEISYQVWQLLESNLFLSTFFQVVRLPKKYNLKPVFFQLKENIIKRFELIFNKLFPSCTLAHQILLQSKTSFCFNFTVSNIIKKDNKLSLFLENFFQVVRLVVCSPNTIRIYNNGLLCFYLKKTLFHNLQLSAFRICSAFLPVCWKGWAGRLPPRSPWFRLLQVSASHPRSRSPTSSCTI